MIKKYIRQLNNSEKKIIKEKLDKNEKDSNKLSSQFRLLAVITLLLLGVFILALFFPNRDWIAIKVALTIIAPILIIGILGLFFPSYLHWKKYHENFKLNIKPKCVKALEENRVDVKKVESHSVYFIEQFEDEGNGYVFDIGGNRCLFLKGQDYEFAQNNNKWPNSSFEIVRIPSTREILGIFAYSDKLKPQKIFKSSEYANEEYLWGSFEEVVNQPANEFIRTILK